MTFGTKLVSVLVARPYKKTDAMTCTTKYLLLQYQQEGTATTTRRTASTRTYSSLTTRIKVTRDVYYANHHKRNVLDIYESSCNANANANADTNINKRSSNHDETKSAFLAGFLAAFLSSFLPF